MRRIIQAISMMAFGKASNREAWRPVDSGWIISWMGRDSHFLPRLTRSLPPNPSIIPGPGVVDDSRDFLICTAIASPPLLSPVSCLLQGKKNIETERALPTTRASPANQSQRSEAKTELCMYLCRNESSSGESAAGFQLPTKR